MGLLASTLTWVKAHLSRGTALKSLDLEQSWLPALITMRIDLLNAALQDLS